MKSDASISSKTSRAESEAGARPRSRKGGGWKKLIPYLIVAGLVGAIAMGLMPKAIEVETAQVNTGPLTVVVLEEGKTRIRHRHVISPPVFGLLKRIELRAGDRIEAGKTVLAVIQAEPASFLNPRAKAESEARLKAAEASRMRSESDLERARAALDLAKKDRSRAEVLKNKGAISAKEWDAMDSNFTVLGRELRTAEFAMQVAAFEVTQAEAALQQAQGSTGMAASEPLKIVAPVSGFVLNVMEENSRIVAAGTVIMEVGDPNDLEAEIELLSSDAVGVRPGAEVSIEQWGGEKPLRGTVNVVEPGAYTKVSALGVEEQRVKVRVNFTDPLPAGQPLGDRFRVEARIITWSEPHVLQVPTGALFRRGGDWMTFLMESGHARATKVQIAHNNGTAAEVRSGLNQGQTVILHPPDSLTEGTSVRAR
ncbi:MAG: efflux transporter, family, subunit [Chthoniobacteraceae bacterium]|nr:efflux transporter, family, subunit [Chthoniobacteraceae bacterium]